MMPLIKGKARLTIDVKTGKYWRGDIVVYFFNRQLVTHRVLEIKKGKRPSFLLKGDNNPQVDGWFPGAKILGRVVKIHYPAYVIDLETRKFRLINQLFLLYSRLNGKFPSLLKLRRLYKIAFLKSFYRRLLRS